MFVIEWCITHPMFKGMSELRSRECSSLEDAVITMLYLLCNPSITMISAPMEVQEYMDDMMLAMHA